MITEIRIENFKSIANLTLQPGRVTVLIGENGSGKSNILEAIAFGAGAAGNKLDREFLYSRGIRVTEEEWMRSAFSKQQSIQLHFAHASNEAALDYNITPLHKGGSFLQWIVEMSVIEPEVEQQLDSEKVSELLARYLPLVIGVDKKTPLVSSVSDEESKNQQLEQDARLRLKKLFAEMVAAREKSISMVPVVEGIGITSFLIYAPENTVLRAFDPEGAIEPLGAKGEGLFKLLQSFSSEEHQDRFAELKELLHTLGWFEDLFLPTPDDAMRDRIRIRDGLLPPDKSLFDQRSANEGFLLLLFYFVLFLSWRTPKFFAIDNIDTALNPKLCATLMCQLAKLAAKYDKQVIFTTHNPAVLDGLDLNDDEQRLFTVSRNDDGATQVRRVSAPQPQPGERPIKLSEAFLRGLIGGLPKNF